MVAVLCGLDEVEFFGGFFHVFLGFVDGFEELVAGGGGVGVGVVVGVVVGGGVFGGGGVGVGGVVDEVAFGYGFVDGLWCDVVRGVVGDLFGAACVGGVDGGLHGGCYFVGVHYGEAVEVSGGSSDGLGEGAFGAEETFFVGVEDGDEGYFGHVEAFAEHVDADEYGEGAFAEFLHDVDSFEGVDVGVDVGARDVESGEVFGEFFGHAFGECCDECSFVAVDAGADFVEEVVDLVE